MQTFTSGLLTRRDERWSIEIRHVLEFDNVSDALRFAEAINKLETAGIPTDPVEMKEHFKKVARQQSVIVNW